MKDSPSRVFSLVYNKIMKHNKGFAQVLIIIAVLAVVAVGGIAYYAGKSSDSIPANIQENDNINNPVVNSDTTTSSITVLSPNGGEVWTIGSKYTIKWNTKNIPSTDKVSITIRRVPPPQLPADGQEFDPIIFTDLQNTGSKEWTISDMYPVGNYVITVNGYHSLPLLPGNYVSDESNKSFSIVSGTANTEVFNNQPGAIKSITVTENNQWVLAVDLLTRNPNWVGGDPSTGGFFINQNSQIRNLNVNSTTKTYKCVNTTANLLTDASSFITYMQNVKKSWGQSNQADYTAYFDINGANIITIYEQCLP